MKQYLMDILREFYTKCMSSSDRRSSLTKITVLVLSETERCSNELVRGYEALAISFSQSFSLSLSSSHQQWTVYSLWQLGGGQWRAEVLWCPGPTSFFRKKFHFSCQNFWWPFYTHLHLHHLHFYLGNWMPAYRTHIPIWNGRNKRP